MNRIEKAQRFHDLHVKGQPLILYNIWDAGSAHAVAKGGAQALATGSASVAGAHGYPDGEQIPLELLERILSHITASTDLPVSLDFEGGYATEPNNLAENVARMIDAGAIGMNFEDQIVNGKGIHEKDTQCQRIAAIRARADQLGIPFFINARTDLFLKEQDRAKHADLLEQAIERASAYEEAGASGFFAPGLVDETLIGQLCKNVRLPVNIMQLADAPQQTRLGELGVARISHGPFPFRKAMKWLTEQAETIYKAG